VVELLEDETELLTPLSVLVVDTLVEVADALGMLLMLDEVETLCEVDDPLELDMLLEVELEDTKDELKD